MRLDEFVIKQTVSVVGVLILIALAWWAKIPRKLDPLDEARARALLTDEFPRASIDTVWLAADGQGAIAKAGDDGLILTAMGDGYVARSTRWADLQEATPKNGRLSIRLRDFGAPRVTVTLAAWPPQGAAA
jgi:hypothetical protein